VDPTVENPTAGKRERVRNIPLDHASSRLLPNGAVEMGCHMSNV
jgi:hypothetical protein